MNLPPVDAPPPPLRLPLGRVALGLAALSLVLAALAGYALAAWMGSDAPGVAAAAALLGMAVTALPVGALFFSLARAAERQPPAEAPPALGGALTRSQFITLAEREWSRARRYGTGAALLLVEVDRFGRLHERLGSAAADALLRAMVLDIAPTLRGADALAHFGEGQLAVFLAHADSMGSLDVAERVRERTEVLELPGLAERLRATVSVGVAHLRPAHLHLQALLEDAHDALAAARHAGGNCVRAAPVEPSRQAAPGASDAGRGGDRRARKP
jgi:diguanylate cyclase